MGLTGRSRELIDRLLAQLTDAERVGGAPAGFTFAGHDPATIDDGEYGDPDRNTRPEFMKEQERGWEPVPSTRK